MRTIGKYWYLLLLLLSALIVNENLVQWILAVKVGGHTVASGFRDAYEYFTILGYLFFTAFRLVPYVGLGALLVVLSRLKARGYFNAVLTGGFIGILALFVWGAWMAQRPFYTDEHVSSTTAIAFLFLPFYCLLAGAAGAALTAGAYTPFRLISKRRRK